MYIRKYKRIVIVVSIAITILFSIGIRNSSKARENVTYKILVDVENSQMFVFKNDELIKEYKCSGGKASTPSPIGTWTIISKGKWGEGFGGNWMGFNVPWGKFGIHGNEDTSSVGWPSSHGCIRMYNKDVAELYNMIPVGTKVTIVDGVYREFGKGFRYLKSGMYGSDVKAIQERLKELGFFFGTANGVYGAATEEAVKAFCRENKLPVQKTISPELQQKMGFSLID